MRIVDLRLSSLDIARLVIEYKRSIVNSYIANVYKYGESFFFKLRGVSGKRFLVIEPSVRFNLTNQVCEWEQSSVVAKLRSEIRDRRIVDIHQYGFDRIVNIDIDGGYSLICEFMPRGVLCLLKDQYIVTANKFMRMKDRSIVPGVRYLFPPNPPPNIWDMPYEGFKGIVLSASSIRRGLMSLGLGLKYSLELCHRTNVDCDAPPTGLTEKQIEEIYECMRNLLADVATSQRSFVYFEDNNPILFAPIQLEIASNYEQKSFQSFDDAIDFFFSYTTVGIEKRATLEKLEKRRHELLDIKSHQEATIKAIREKIERLRGSIELIYENYQLINKILATIRKAKDEDKASWDYIRNRIMEGKKQGIRGLDIIDSIQTDGTIVLRFGDKRIPIHYRDTVNDIARKIFDKIKKLEKKLEGAQKALRETIDKLNNIDKEIEKIQREKTYVVLEPKREWYHGFRWFTTTNGFLVIAGKDAQTNDTLLRKYLEPSDLILHADIPGGAVVIMKNAADRAKKQDIFEAMTYAAAYSKAWVIGYTAIDVFITRPKDISLHPPSGTYLKKGSFIVRKKEIVRNVPLEICIGLKLDIDNNNISSMLLSGPKNRICNICDICVILRPGKLNKNATTRKIYNIFLEWIKNKLDTQVAKRAIKIEKIAELVPGPSEIVEIITRSE